MIKDEISLDKMLELQEQHLAYSMNKYNNVYIVLNAKKETHGLYVQEFGTKIYTKV